MTNAVVKAQAVLKVGTAGSGDFGHAGRPGHVGGSAPRGAGRGGAGNPDVLGLPEESHRYVMSYDPLHEINQTFVAAGVEDRGAAIPIMHNLYAEYIGRRGEILYRFQQGIYDVQDATNRLEELNRTFASHMGNSAQPLTRAERMRAGIPVENIGANTPITHDVARPPTEPDYNQSGSVLFHTNQVAINEGALDISSTLQNASERQTYQRERQAILNDYVNGPDYMDTTTRRLNELNAEHNYRPIAEPLTPEQQWWHDVAPDTTAADINNIYSQATGGNAKVDTKTFITSAYEFKDPDTGIYSKISSVDKAYGDIRVKGNFYDPDGSSIGNFTRIIHDDGEIHNDYMTLSRTGTGFGAKFYKNAEDNYIANGIKRVTIFANISVGGYAWARMGFDFEDNDARRSMVGRLQYAFKVRYPGLRVPPSFGNIKHSWTIAAYTGPDGFRLGKNVMLGTSWDAVKHLEKGSLSLRVGQHYYDTKKKGKK